MSNPNVIKCRDYAISILEEHRATMRYSIDECREIRENLIKTLHSVMWIGLIDGSEFNFILASIDTRIIEINPLWMDTI